MVSQDIQNKIIKENVSGNYDIVNKREIKSQIIDELNMRSINELNRRSNTNNILEILKNTISKDDNKMIKNE